MKAWFFGLFGIDTRNVLEEFGEGHIESVGDFREVQKGDIASTDFYGREIRTIHSDSVRELLLANALFAAQIFYTSSHCYLEFVLHICRL